LPLGWPAPIAGLSATEAVVGTIGLTLLPVLAAALATRSTFAALARHPELRSAEARRFARLRRLILALNLSGFAASVFGLGWAWLVWHTALWDGTLAPFAELLVPAPFLVAMAANWLVYYPADRAIHYAGSTRPFPGPLTHWLNQVRRFALFVLLPAVLFSAQQTVTRYVPVAWLESPWFFAAGIGAAVLVFIWLPVAMKGVLGMRSFPPGPRRDRFEALAKRLNVRFRDVLIWPTHGSLATAVMIGVVPRWRYCAFSDRLLDELTDDELDAVFGHEIGHVKHAHVPFYLVFFLFSAAVISTGVAALLQALQVRDLLPTGFLSELVVAAPLGVLGAYLFVVFGWLSRRCERQADLFGARAVSCGRKDCAVHTLADYPARGLAPMCPTGIRVFVNALQQVAYVNGLDPHGGDHSSFLHAAWAWVRAWQHGPIPARIAFLRSLLVDPTRERVAQRRIALGRWGLLVGLVAATLLIGSTIGWTDVWKAL
jgi:Zn-dependent protease with chaperone function